MSGSTPKRIAVIGAGGFIGRRLSAAAAAAGNTVHAISSSDGSFDSESGLLTPPSIDGPLDAVVYLSQSPRYREVPQQASHLWSVNVVSAIVAAQWGRRLGARHFIYASSGTIYEPSFTPHRETDPLRRDRGYALSKIHAEEALQQFEDDLVVTCARCFGVYGPGQQGKIIPNLTAAIRRGRSVEIHRHPLDASDTNGVRLSLGHVDDIVRAFLKLIDQPRPGPINVTSPEVLSIREIAVHIATALGVAPRFEMAADPREGDVIADTSRVCELMDRPFASFALSIRDVVDAGVERSGG